MDNIIDKYRHWKFKNTFFLFLTFVVLFVFSDSDIFIYLIEKVSNLKLLGAFIVGIFFVSTFTVVPAGIVLFHLAKELDPIGVIIFAGTGAMIGDYLIFRFFKDRVFEELRPVFSKLGNTHISRLFSTRFFAWLAPVLGAIIIASPLPNEAGIGLLGIAKLKDWQFIVISFILNLVGILIVVLLSNLS